MRAQQTVWAGWVSALLMLLCATGAVRGEDPLPPLSYKIRQADPTTGTNIPSEVVRGSAIPLNRRYRELTPEQQRLVKSQYEPMVEGDEPPFPIDGLGPVYAAVQKVVQKLQTGGDMAFAVDVNAAGEATAVQVLEPADPELTRTVASVLMLTKYKPGMCRGKPCAMAVPFRFGARMTR